MQKIILLNLLLYALVFASEGKKNYELHTSVMIGFDPEAQNASAFSLAGVGTVIDILFFVTPNSAIKGGWGARAASYNSNFSVNYMMTELMYEYDRNNHRVGCGFSYYYDIKSEASPAIYPVVPQFRDALGYILSYHFFEKTHKALSAVTLGSKAGLVKGILFGLKYEYAAFKDRLTVKNYPASILSFSFGVVF